MLSEINFKSQYKMLSEINVKKPVNIQIDVFMHVEVNTTAII